MHELGMDSVKEEEVLKKTGYARTDSKGYRLPIKKLSKELGYIQKNGGKLELTGEGLRSMESKNGAQKPTTNEEQHEKWKQKLCEMSSAPKKAISAFWGVLLDGKPHSRDELLKATEYKRQDSAGFKSIMKLCKQFGLLEKEKGEHMFSDKMFPFGRP